MSNHKEKTDEHTRPLNFIEQIIEEDLASQKHDHVITRFPPEPNGYLHIGHAKAICINFGLAEKYKPRVKPGHGYCNLRFDDTNPEKETEEFMHAIREDIEWLGFEWQGDPTFASDQFETLYEFAVALIKKGKAFVCSLNGEQMREYRGTLTEPGKESPNRNRSIEENLKLFQEMREGKHPDGSFTLRAKIDMKSPNMNMRDPTLYRVKKIHHLRTGDAWPIYPMYDYTHCLCDALEGITHSLCSLEFEDHRPLYDWVLNELRQEIQEKVGISYLPRQIEFARLKLNYTLISKRYFKQLVDEKYVNGWDDPRMVTIKGLRRRGYQPEAIRAFCDRIGVAKKNSVIDFGMLEEHVRWDYEERAPRAFCVLDPIKVVIENYPESKTEELTAPLHPQNEAFGTRTMTFSREVYIDREDFMEEPPSKYFRLAPGREVRLRYGYIIKCNEVIKDADGRITELKCTYDPNTLGKNPEGRKVKGVIHWVSVSHGSPAEVRVYERFYTAENPLSAAQTEGKSFTDYINPESLMVFKNARVEQSLVTAPPESFFQFERLGYFCADRYDSKPGKLVFNKAVSLKK